MVAFGREMTDAPENPIIERYLRTGYPDNEPAYPRCPICWEECGTLYKDINGDVIGCENCVKAVDAWEG